MAQLREDLDAYRLFKELLGGFGEFDVYELTAGTITTPEKFIELSFPAYYITNITSAVFNSTEFKNEVMEISNELEPMFYNKESFVGGVATISFVLSGTTTASWMMFLLLFLASNTIPNSLILTNLFFSVSHSVMLVKLTKILQCQYSQNYSDMDEVKNCITFGTSYLVVRSISTLLVWISWVDIMVQISKYSYKKKIIICGCILSIINFAIRLAYGFLYTRMDNNEPGFKAIKGIHYAFDYLMLIIFICQVARYTIRKRQFAYNRKTMALAVFSWIIMLTPFVFCTIDVISYSLRTWSSYIFSFAILSSIVVIWEWIHTIRIMELKYERKAVLGRRISNDSFLDDPMNPNLDPKHHHNNGYILKSLNLLTLLSSLNFWGKLQKYFQTKTHQYSQANSDHPEDVSFIEMVDGLSRQSSYQGSAVSYDNHPEFNIDHRYLRNTPSSFAGSRDTPLSMRPASSEPPRSKGPTPRINEESTQESHETNDDQNKYN
ncbi:pH-response regulator protein [Wickerhamomyces ciferrii]|uniref:PH-response regulator protein n=1 Tax=Wickerhamomyces ciferrii (strain ATCC 14091 / BCRC 22168 / CBS 111 / JCM 3599 / NBRC 0793 / NRRL Y-1031 F-60-10) TaxID=1206466 RepID=K0KQQ1_WICCF|nr:pH-response regulator protein [Wickerhamomyces ciferrii]CCH45396.1 pH-response regulator protein [Wickerhamomyces ciferrii]